MRTDTTSEPNVAPLSGGWLIGGWALVTGALALAAGGFVNSFSAVRDALEPSLGDRAWTIPVLIDVGIAVFSGIDLLFTRLDMRVRWLRLVPWTLNGATIWLNVAVEHTSLGVVAHAAPPVLWIVTVELAGHFIRARTGLDTSPVRRRAAGKMDRIRAWRWLMAPWSTLVIKRWMIVKEEQSFERAYARWWARKEAKWELQTTYGVLAWRLRAPRQLRGRYRYGHMTPTDTKPSTSEFPSVVAQEVPPPTTGPATATAHRRRPAKGRRRATLDDVRRVADALTVDRQPVNRTAVTRRLRDEGFSLANDRADQYLASVHEEGSMSPEQGVA